MKLKSLSLATAAALGATGTAQAFDPGTTTPDFQIVIAGASAPTVTLRNVIIRDICDPPSAPHTIDVLIHGGGTKHYNIACEIGGKKVLFRKNDDGSGAGVTPVDQETVRPFLNIGIAGCAGGSHVKTAGSDAYVEHLACGNSAAALTNLIPDFGISDIEPSAFVGGLAPVEGPFANVSNMDVQPVAGLAFGFIVTTDLYRALQVAQFPLASHCNPDPAGGTDSTRPDSATGLFHLRVPPANGIKDVYEVPASDSGIAPADGAVSEKHTKGDTLVCMPSLSRDEIRSMLARDLTSGDNVWVGPLASDTLSVKAAGKDYAGTGGQMHLCRRSRGSGTQAITAIHFLGTTCNGQGQVAVPAATCGGSNICGVNSNTSASGVDICLKAHDTANVWAYGYQSLEKNASLEVPYRFVKIDGVAPTLANMLAGNYFNFGELTLQRRGNISDLNNVPIAEIAAANAVWSALVNRMSTPANVATMNDLALTRHPFGQSGYAARGTPVFPPNFASPINPMTHVKPGTNVQESCAGPYAAPVGIGTGKSAAQ